MTSILCTKTYVNVHIHFCDHFFTNILMTKIFVPEFFLWRKPLLKKNVIRSFVVKNFHTQFFCTQNFLIIFIANVIFCFSFFLWRKFPVGKNFCEHFFISWASFTGSAEITWLCRGHLTPGNCPTIYYNCIIFCATLRWKNEKQRLGLHAFGRTQRSLSGCCLWHCFASSAMQCVGVGNLPRGGPLTSFTWV